MVAIHITFSIITIWSYLYCCLLVALHILDPCLSYKRAGYCAHPFFLLSHSLIPLGLPSLSLFLLLSPVFWCLITRWQIHWYDNLLLIFFFYIVLINCLGSMTTKSKMRFWPRLTTSMRAPLSLRFWIRSRMVCVALYVVIFTLIHVCRRPLVLPLSGVPHSYRLSAGQCIILLPIQSVPPHHVFPHLREIQAMDALSFRLWLSPCTWYDWLFTIWALDSNIQARG